VYDLALSPQHTGIYMMLERQLVCGGRDEHTFAGGGEHLVELVENSGR
jgi:hypothetical protein